MIGPTATSVCEAQVSSNSRRAPGTATHCPLLTPKSGRPLYLHSETFVMIGQQLHASSDTNGEPQGAEAG